MFSGRAPLLERVFNRYTRDVRLEHVAVFPFAHVKQFYDQ